LPVDYFDDKAIRLGLRNKTIRGGAYTAVSQGIRTVAMLIVTPLLTRLLQPEDFGLVAMAMVVTGFAGMFVDAGLSMATVQREQLTHQQASNLFWVASILGTTIAAICVCLSPIFAIFFQDDRLTFIIMGSSTAFIINGLAIQYRAMLRRGLQFVDLAIADIGSILFGQAIGLSWAFAYSGSDGDYWALVLIPVCAAFASLLIVYWRCHWRPSFFQRGAGTRSMIFFGANLTGFNTLNFFARNADNLLIGWWWGPTQLGFYSRIYQVMMLPVQRLNGPLTALVVPVLSRVQKEDRKYQDIYRWTVERLLLISCPAMAYIAVTADWVTVAYFSEAFAPAGPMLRWLALAALWQSLSASIGWLFISQGRDREMFRWGVIHSTAVVLSFLIGLPFGATGVAIAYCCTFNGFCLPLAFWLISRKGPIDIRLLTGVVLNVGPVAAMVGISTLLARHLMPSFDLWISLLVTAIVAAVAWLLSMISLPFGRQVLTQSWGGLRNNFSRLSSSNVA